ncbi:MAG: membrane protein insertion efficiency factor YidD [Deltaproteobacteria bacterium]|nr:membrane protein insertion efficiency factor YidD [Deltaproteobacteria bacterium]
MRLGSAILSGLFSLVFYMLFTLSSAFCGEVPPRKAEENPVEPLSGRTPSSGNPGTWLASFFRNHISAVDGDRCPSSPSCSSYSLQAFQKHGFFVGWVMTVDRLIHEGDEPNVSPMVRQNGKYYVFDPVENNDFWWHSGVK